MTSGRSIGPYEVQERLGGGGTGVVLRCLQRDTGHAFALKLPIQNDWAARELLRREIGILRRLARARLRGVVRLVDSGTQQDIPWYAMELVEGRSLRFFQAGLWSAAHATPLASSAVDATTTVHVRGAVPPLVAARYPAARRKPELREGSAAGVRKPKTLPSPAAGQLEQVLRLALRLSEILVQLHAEGVVHGDLSPSNILLRDVTDPVLIDFGTALAATEVQVWRELPWARVVERGTPGYVAPELIRGEAADARCDLYSLGCILYELLTGRRAFEAERVGDILTQHLSREPDPLTTHVRAIPSELAQLVQQLTLRDPTARLARAEDVCHVLRLHLDAQARSSSPPPNQVALFRPRLHGREDALTELLRLHDAALAGRAQFVLLGGASGIGKTRLMNELGRRAAQGGSCVVWCRARQIAPDHIDGAAHGRLELLTELLNLLADTYRADGTEGEPLRALHDLAGLEPALFRASKALPREMSPQEIERRAFDGLARLMRHLAAPTGLVLLLDDLHCSDELSLRFLGQFKRLASSRVAIIANYRSEDAQSVLPAVGAVATRRIDLGPLRPEDTRAMIQDLLASVTLPEGLTALLAHQSEGNPFFVAEYTRALISNGMLQRTPTTGWLLRGHESERLAVPDSIEGLLSLRVQRLSERARATLRLICVLERDFAASTFQALAGAEHDSSEVLEELVAREVLVASSPGRYRFAHDKLREGQERTLGALERRDQHALVARHLEQRVLLLTVGQRATLGFHLARAGEPRRALAYLTPAAAATASAGHTLERAAALYRLAVEQCDALPGEGNALRAPLLEALADVLATQAKHAEARDYLAQWLAELAPDERLARARAFRKTATSHWTVHDYAGAAAALDLAEQELAALAVVPNAEVWSELIQVRIGRFEQLYFAGQIGAELDQLVRELAPLVDARGSADQVCMYYFMASSHAMLRARYAFDESAVRLADRGLQAASGLPAHRVAFAHFNLGFALALGTREQCHQAIAQFELALPHAELAGDVTLLSRIRTYLATTWLRLGNVERTEAAARAALDAAIEAQLAPYVAAAHACQGWSEWKHGRDVEAMSLLEAARTRWKSHPHKFPVQSLALFPLLDLAQLRDDFNAVHALLEELWTGLPAFPPPLSTAIENAIAALERTAGAEAALAVAEVLRLAQVCAFL